MVILVESICIKKKKKAPVSTKHTHTHLTTAPDLASYPSATPSSLLQDGYLSTLLYSHVLERIIKKKKKAQAVINVLLQEKS